MKCYDCIEQCFDGRKDKANDAITVYAGTAMCWPCVKQILEEERALRERVRRLQESVLDEAAAPVQTPKTIPIASHKTVAKKRRWGG